MKVIRWGGLAGFLVFGLILVIIGFFFIDNWLKAGLEAGGTRVNGAEVNVGDLDLTLSPLGMEVRRVQITNAREPSKNLFELDTVRLQLRLPLLFLGKVNIEDLTVDGMRAGTERARPGRVLEKEEEDQGPSATEKARDKVGERIAAVRSELPPADTAARDALSGTREQAEETRETLDQALEKVQSAVADLPDQESLDNYDRRIESLREREVGNLEQLRQLQADLESLQADVIADQTAIASARKAANEAASNSKQAMEAFLGAPAEDWADLREAYPLNQASAMKAGRLLLGDAIFDRVDQIQTYYRQVSPWLRRLAPEKVEEEAGPQRLDGRFVRYPHPNPSPDFLMQQALVGFEAQGWPWTLALEDVTGQQNLTDRPVSFQLARGSEGKEGLLIEGTLDRRGDEKVDRFEITGRNLGWEPRQVDFMDAALDWTPGRVDMGGTVEVQGNNLDGRLALTFNQTEFAAEGSGEVARLLGRALADIADFEVAIRIGGQVDTPEIQLTSDLDDRLNSALSSVLREEYDRWLAQARETLDAEVARLREPLEKQANRVQARRNEVDKGAEEFQQKVVARLQAVKEEIAAERTRLNSQVENERKKAEDAAKDALDKLKVPGF